MGEKKRILIVEDQALLAAIIEEQLEKVGYEVMGVVSSGEKAIEQAIEDKPDLIIMDIILKGEIDGITAVEEIHRDSPIPVIYMTASSDIETIQRANNTKHKGYLKKPVNKDDLEITIAAVLRQD